MSEPGIIATARLKAHAALLKTATLTFKNGVASNADGTNANSKKIAEHMIRCISQQVPEAEKLAGQQAGNYFEQATAAFINDTFLKMNHLRPGQWRLRRGGSIAATAQYRHLSDLEAAAEKNPELRTFLRSDYLIKPDIVVERQPEPDEVINTGQALVDDSSVARNSVLRRSFNPLPILHASISCKWTIRSDRAQNARSEALVLMRNRKGSTPHICVVTAEPLPSRISSLAYGTGDIDCVYHIALNELIDAMKTLNLPGLADQAETLATMVHGMRLKDISDLPLDLAV